MGAKLSRKKSEAGIGAETMGAVEETLTTDGSPATDNQETKNSGEDNPDSSPGVLQTLTQAVGETVNQVTEQIATPVEDVVNKGVEAIESALASVSLFGKEAEAPEQEPEKSEVDLTASDEPGLLDDLLKSPISEALMSGVAVVSEAITGEKVEDTISCPAPSENKDLMECLDKVETPSLDLLDCKLPHESAIPNSDPSFNLEDLGQSTVDAVDLI